MNINLYGVSEAALQANGSDEQPVFSDTRDKTYD